MQQCVNGFIKMNTKYPTVYKSPITQIRCAQEAMLGCCISYIKDPYSGKVEYYNFYRSKMWVDAAPDYKSFPTPYYIQQSKMIANKLIWC